MERLLKIANLETEIPNLETIEVTVKCLSDLILENKPKTIDSIQKLLPNFKLFDCHRLKATIQDLQK